MDRNYSEEDITWSCIEKYVPYAKVYWCMGNDGIPIYTFFDEHFNRIYLTNE